ncbi:MAG: GNAT family N-acetyltransferase [Gemmataceae bacterium]
MPAPFKTRIEQLLDPRFLMRPDPLVNLNGMMIAEPARVDELAEAFRLVACCAEESERERRVAAGLELVRRGELDRGGILVVRGPGGLRGAIVCTPLIGGGSLIWPPQTRDRNERLLLEDQLMQEALHWLKLRGVKLVQALLTGHELESGQPLLRAGFQHVTALEYLRHWLELPLATLGGREQLRYEVYDQHTEQLLHETLLRTYEQTQDFPEVNGVRTIEEIVAGHRAQGLHDPQLWWLALHRDEAVGVLLLTAMPDGDGWDVIYLGVVPEARGRGFGRELALKAVYETRLAEQRQLTLSVDARNQPARKLYENVGFECHDQREVFLLVWH